MFTTMFSLIERRCNESPLVAAAQSIPNSRSPDHRSMPSQPWKSRLAVFQEYVEPCAEAYLRLLCWSALDLGSMTDADLHHYWLSGWRIACWSFSSSFGFDSAADCFPKNFYSQTPSFWDAEIYRAEATREQAGSWRTLKRMLRGSTNSSRRMWWDLAPSNRSWWEELRRSRKHPFQRWSGGPLSAARVGEWKRAKEGRWSASWYRSWCWRGTRLFHNVDTRHIELECHSVIGIDVEVEIQTIRGGHRPILYKRTACKEQTQLGANEATGNPYKQHVDELLLLQAFSEMTPESAVCAISSQW